MSVMHTTEIKAVIELQAKDRVVDDYLKKLAAIPENIAELNAAFEAQKAQMTAAKDALTALLVNKKSKELSVAEKEEEIKKHQRDLNAVKENVAFKALLTEIERAKAEQDAAETEILALMDAIDKAAVEDKKMQQEVKNLEAEKNVKVSELNAAQVKLQAVLEAAKADRGNSAEKLSAPILEKYEFIRSKRKGIAVVEIKEDKTGKISCGGCDMGLTAQKIVDIKTPDAIVFCDNCQRMIYLKATVYGAPVQEL